MSIKIECDRCGYLMTPSIDNTRIDTTTDIDGNKYAESYHLCKKCTTELIKWIKETKNED